MKIKIISLIVLLLLCFAFSPLYANDVISPTKSQSVEKVNDTIPKSFPFGIIGSAVIALIGLIGGVIGSIAAPWVNWGIEKRRLKHTRKMELIKEWRTFIEAFDFENQNFGNSTVYGAMRPYMEEEIIKKFEAQRTIHIPPDGGRGDQLFKQWASDQVAMIEKKWKLI